MQLSALRNRLFVYSVIAAGMTGAAMPSLMSSAGVAMTAPAVELDAAGEPIIEPETTPTTDLSGDTTGSTNIADESGTEEATAGDTVICHIGHGHNRHAHRHRKHENAHNWRTKTMTAEAAEQHIAHGDHEGACTGEEAVPEQTADVESHGKSSDDDDESKGEHGQNHGRGDEADDDFDEDENEDDEPVATTI